MEFDVDGFRKFMKELILEAVRSMPDEIVVADDTTATDFIQDPAAGFIVNRREEIPEKKSNAPSGDG